jgi:hypothetical protein
VPHDEVTSQFSQARIQRGHTVEQKLNAAIVGWQAGQSVRIEYEHGEHAARRQQGVMRCGMIVHAQIAPEPDEGVSQSHLLCAESMQSRILLSTISQVCPAGRLPWPVGQFGVN